MKPNHFGTLKKENGKLTYIKSSDSAAFEEFKKSLDEGARIELYMEEVHDDGSLAQLALIHAMIRSLSNHTGYTFAETKMLVKEQAGLCLTRNTAGKEYLLCASFGDCSKEQLSDAIQACKELGEQVGYNLN